MGTKLSPAASKRDMDLLTEIVQLRNELMIPTKIPKAEVEIAGLMRHIRSLRNRSIYNEDLLCEEAKPNREAAADTPLLPQPDDRRTEVGMATFNGARPRQQPDPIPEEETSPETPENSLYEANPVQQ